MRNALSSSTLLSHFFFFLFFLWGWEVTLKKKSWRVRFGEAFVSSIQILSHASQQALKIKALLFYEFPFEVL